MLGLAASPLLAKIATVVPGLEAARQYTILDLRAAALAALQKWFAEELDRITFETLTKDSEPLFPPAA